MGLVLTCSSKGTQSFKVGKTYKQVGKAWCLDSDLEHVPFSRSALCTHFWDSVYWLCCHQLDDSDSHQVAWVLFEGYQSCLVRIML